MGATATFEASLVVLLPGVATLFGLARGWAIALAAVTAACVWMGSYRVLRWPIFLLLGVRIAASSVLYVVARLCILLVERQSASSAAARGDALRGCKSYDEWRRAAESADAAEGRDAWRRETADHAYDYRAVQGATRRLRAARDAADYAALMAELLRQLTPNCNGELDYTLYARCRAGTKHDVEQHRDELVESLRFLAALEPPSGSALHAARADFCRAARAGFGGSALVLSGGALLGIYHFGVVRALLELRMLPSVLCGASAGAVIAAVACTRRDDELEALLDDQRELYRELGSHGPFHGSVWWKLRRLLSGRTVYDPGEWHRHMQWFTRGLTFREAYEYTGRVLNVTCTPVRSRGKKTPPLQLNHLTAPNVEIASAVCASACVPILVPPSALLEKAADGSLIPYWREAAGDDNGDGNGDGGDGDGEGHHTFRDGSYEADVPVASLAAQFGATFSIVSQVNPHVVPFYAHLQGRPGRPSGGRDRTGAWRGGFLLGACCVYLLEDMKGCLRSIQRLELSLDLFGVDWSNLWLQTSDGSVLITPDIGPEDYYYVLSNVPSAARLRKVIHSMRVNTWEAAALIATRMHVEHALHACCEAAGGGGGGVGGVGSKGRAAAGAGAATSAGAGAGAAANGAPPTLLRVPSLSPSLSPSEASPREAEAAAGRGRARRSPGRARR